MQSLIDAEASSVYNETGVGRVLAAKGRRLARRILIIITVLLFLLCLAQVAVHFTQPDARLQNWPSDPDQVAAYMVRTFCTIVLLLSVVPYLIASILMDRVRSSWRFLPVAGIWLYVILMLPSMSGDGPYMGMIRWAGPMHVLPFFGFPILLTVKFLWHLLE